MREFFKQGVVQVIAQLGLCTIMCGATIGLLISSGWLLYFSNEGRSKTFLIPALIAFAIVIFMYVENKKTCHQKGFSTTGAHARHRSQPPCHAQELLILLPALKTFRLPRPARAD